MSRRLRGVLMAGAAAAVLFNVVTFYVNGWPGQPSPAIYVITPTIVLLAYLAMGLVAWQARPRERIGLMFTVTGYAWLLPSLTQLHYPLPYTIGILTSYLYQACLAHLALAWPYGRLRSRRDRIVVGANYLWNLANNAVRMLFWNPRTSGCGTACPANLFLVNTSHRLLNDIGDSINPVIGICMTTVVVALIAARWRSARGYARRAMTALIWVAVPIGAYTVVLNIPGGRGLSSLVLYGIGPLVLITAPAAYATGLIRAQTTRSAIGAALVDLEPGPAPARLRDALARALGDPTLELAFRSPGRGCYIDTRDAAIQVEPLPAGRMATPLGPGGEAVLVHDAELRHEPELVRVAAAAANLALEHSRLQAEIQAQLEQVRASRARIVEAGDTARRRLERDLHDGAQQRLVTLSLALAMARSQAAGIDPGLESLLQAAGKEAAEALAELRELGRGIHPAVLTETGLTGAIQALVERSPVAATVTAVPAGRFAAPVEATAYFVVSEALTNVAKHAPDAAGRIGIWQQDSQLVVEVSDNGPGGAQADTGSGLRGLADRVASVNGVLQVDSTPGRGTRLQARIPCQ